jgi:two-component system response regulator FixJ
VKINGNTICLLDDDPSILKAISRMLSCAGWRAQSFVNPIAFLDYARDQRPRIAVLDILMPMMNGLEVQARLRHVSPSTGVIVVTSNDDPGVRSKAMDAGAMAFFLKPVDKNEFLAAIASTFAKQARCSTR